MNARAIVLCADDFAFSVEISQAILSLVQQGRISAVSCMTMMPHWAALSRELLSHQATIDIGLHLDLTECQRERLPKLILHSHLRLLDQQRLAAIIQQQLDIFMEQMGRAPDFIDGHQHVHHLPVIREALLRVYSAYFPNKGPYVRVSSNRNTVLGDVAAFPKAPIIALTGALALRRRLAQSQIPHNRSFAGIYPFADSKNYRDYFQRFLLRIRSGGLIVCHPGFESEIHLDPLSASRFDEYCYLTSAAFLEDCERQQITIGRFLATYTQSE
jgi:predicted glycoside hydrolase/deacetylase ChbG (UPF0249 family)